MEGTRDHTFTHQGGSLSFKDTPRILVVEDVALMQNLIKQILGSIGISKPDVASNGNAALNLMKFREYDLVIADWNMPGMSGLDLLKAIRADNKLKHLAFLMVTAEGEAEYIKQAAEAGANGYLTKPITRNILVDKIADVLAAAVH